MYNDDRINEVIVRVLKSLRRQRVFESSDEFWYDTTRLAAETPPLVAAEQEFVLKKLDDMGVIKADKLTVIYDDVDTDYICGIDSKYQWSPHIESKAPSHVGQFAVDVSEVNLDKLITKYETSSPKQDDSLHHATLKLDTSNFVVSCEGEKYVMPTLRTGLTEEIIIYAMKNVDERITLKDLIEEYPSRKNQLAHKNTNIAQILANNLISKELSAFADIQPRSIKIISQTDLTNHQLEAIQNTK